MEDDLNRELYRSVYEERQLLLARLKAYQDRFEKVKTLADVAIGRHRKNEALLAIRAIAEEALAL